MALPPQKFREIVFQLLFSLDFHEGEMQELACLLMKELKVTRSSLLAAQARVESLLERREHIDRTISSHSPDYTFERISRAEKAILRLGVFELLFDPSIPPKVAIAEAIRMCRKFASPESARFVNGVLDAAYQAQSTAGALS